MAAAASPAAQPGWWRLEMACPAELEESLLWRLPDLGIPRVAVRHHPETPSQRELVAWLPEMDWPPQRHRELEQALAPLAEPFGLELPPLRWQRQADEDWSLSWKRHWQPDPVGQRLLILPAWLDVPEEHHRRLILRMDPGSAFGTGSHPTTRLCIEALEQLADTRDGEGLRQARVADLGCGSGILGLAALGLGAAAVLACDTDPLAVHATLANTRLNGWRLPREGGEAATREDAAGDSPGELQVAQGSIEVLADLLAQRPADVLLCNILAPVIQALCPAFGSVLSADGVGFLSGLLLDQVEDLQQSLSAAGWRAELSGSQPPWGLLTIRARTDVT
ncbi:MAG: 50S ribosomal protein L11 methyltransferase [Synechococcaceae cyanobacterium]|nr:50S ribosomal protein L11 methyltransferase [Synechococcaceae cyanobacterium]